jgi:hypothetical protein
VFLLCCQKVESWNNSKRDKYIPEQIIILIRKGYGQIRKWPEVENMGNETEVFDDFEEFDEFGESDASRENFEKVMKMTSLEEVLRWETGEV